MVEQQVDMWRAQILCGLQDWCAFGLARQSPFVDFTFLHRALDSLYSFYVLKDNLRNLFRTLPWNLPLNLLSNLPRNLPRNMLWKPAPEERALETCSRTCSGTCS